MRKVTVDAKSKDDAIKQCNVDYGWTPDTIREVDSGLDHVRSWLCFESARDAKTWDKQK